MFGYIKEKIESGRNNRKMLLLIVYIALFLDNMLLTTVVPIIPEYLFRLEHPNDTHLLLKPIDRSTTAAPTTVKPSGPEMVAMRQALPDLLGKLKNPRVMEEGVGYGYYQFQPVNFTPASAAFEPTTDTAEVVRQKEHQLLTTENVKVGLMFGSKALVQLITNPFIGPLTNRVGYTIPMFTGFVIMFLSTLLFAFGTSYSLLFFARTLQGIGSACTSTSGMGMLAQMYPDDKERGAAMGIALGGLALGVLVGPPFGGVLYKFSGKELPFVILALLALFDGTLQLLVLKPKVERGNQEATSIGTLLRDPYIMVSAGAITIGNLGIAMLEPSLPIWMIETMHSDSAERGAAFLPASISYLIGTNIFGPLAHRIGRWLSTLIGMVVIGACLIAIPSATGLGGLVAPNGFMGFAIGMIDASMFPQMGYLVDIRHVGIYGSIYAIADAAFCLAFAFGPYVSGPIVRSLGFPKLMYMIGVISFLYAPLMIFLRNPPAVAEEKTLLISESQSAAEPENGFAPNTVHQEYATYDYDY